MNAQKIYFDDAPYEEDQNIKKCEKLILMDIQNLFFGKTSTYLGDITFYPKY